MAAHAEIGPSSLSRVMLCPGSVRLSRGLPNQSSDAADEGTCLHEACEVVLRSDGLVDPHDLIGRKFKHNGFELEFNELHADYMLPAVEWLRCQPGQMFVETRVSLDPWMPGQFGTCDVAILDTSSRTAIIFDWKWGEGVPVSVYNNKQLKAYALGFLHSVFRPMGVEPETFKLVIEQPRNSSGGRYDQQFEISLADLLAFGEELKETYRKAMSDDGELNPSPEACQFCLVRNSDGGCTAYNAMMFDLLKSRFDDDDEFEPEHPDKITPERRARIVSHASMITRWLASLHEDSLNAALAGNPDPGLKAVLGRAGKRYFTDETTAELLLELALDDRAFKRSLISPSAAEKLLKPKRGKGGDPVTLAQLQKIIDQNPPRPILVDRSDDRPEFQTMKDQFDDLGVL